MKIGNFNISKKTLVILGCVIGFIILLVAASIKKDAEARAKAQAEAQAYLNSLNKGGTPTPVLSYEEQQQQRLIEKYGLPPEGFKWGYSGELIPLSDDAMTAEDVAFTFLRSLTMLDFSTAEKYSSKSQVIDEYRDYYDSTSSSMTNYKDNFLRKQYKIILTSMELGSVLETAVFADGTQYITMEIDILDISNKDFWLEDKSYLFDSLEVFDNVEDDDVKANQFLYDYVLEKYDSGAIGKKTVEFELVLSKNAGSGWLVTNDKELHSVLVNDQGVDIITYIKSLYTEWKIDKMYGGM